MWAFAAAFFSLRGDPSIFTIVPLLRIKALVCDMIVDGVVAFLTSTNIQSVAVAGMLGAVTEGALNGAIVYGVVV